MEKITIYIDGASKGNPGKASIGTIIKDSSGRTLKEFGRTLGNATNNAAEYIALITGLVESLQFAGKEIEIKSDSLLLVKQMQGLYKVKNDWLHQLKGIAEHIASKHEKVTYTHIPREENRQADKLANENAEKTLL